MTVLDMVHVTKAHVPVLLSIKATIAQLLPSNAQWIALVVDLVFREAVLVLPVSLVCFNLDGTHVTGQNCSVDNGKKATGQKFSVHPAIIIVPIALIGALIAAGAVVYHIKKKRETLPKYEHSL